MEEFSQWLNAQLKKHGLTANGFAQKAGMNSTSIKNYTKGRPVKPDQEKKIRDIFRAIESGEDFQADEQPINPGIHSDGYNPAAYERLLEEREARLKEKDQMISSYERTISLLESQLKWLQESFTAKLTPNFRKGVHAGRNLMGIHYNRMRDAQVPQVKLG